jgi:carboxylate-amine ligase
LRRSTLRRAARAANPVTGSVTARHARAVFDRTTPYTVGAEEEFLLVHPVSLEPAPLGDLALVLADGDVRVASEFRACQVEAASPVCVSVADVSRELASVRSLLHDVLSGHALIVAVATHPFAEDPGPVTDGPRYARIAAENPWAGRFKLTCGLHVHVAVGSGETALAVHNALRGYLPEIAALTANAPYYLGRVSGLASVRSHLNKAMPRHGVPPAFSSWEEWGEHVEWTATSGLCPDPSHHWWDLRLHPGYGTIELRVADVQTRIEDSATAIALIQSLIVHLARRHDDGEALPVYPTERITESVWTAARDGVGGVLPDLTSGNRAPTVERLQSLVDELLPVALELGCATELLGVERILAEDGPSRQRRIATTRGTEGLVAWLAEETVGVDSFFPALDAPVRPYLESGA